MFTFINTRSPALMNKTIWCMRIVSIARYAQLLLACFLGVFGICSMVCYNFKKKKKSEKNIKTLLPLLVRLRLTDQTHSLTAPSTEHSRHRKKNTAHLSTLVVCSRSIVKVVSNNHAASVVHLSRSISKKESERS